MVRMGWAARQPDQEKDPQEPDEGSGGVPPSRWTSRLRVSTKKCRSGGPPRIRSPGPRGAPDKAARGGGTPRPGAQGRALTVKAGSRGQVALRNAEREQGSPGSSGRRGQREGPARVGRGGRGAAGTRPQGAWGRRGSLPPNAASPGRSSSFPDCPKGA